MMFTPFVRSDRLAAGLRVWAGLLHRKVFGAWWRELLLVAVLYGAYEVSRGLDSVDVSAALANGHHIMHLEQVWHLDPEQLLNTALHHATLLAVAASYFYSAMHYIVTPVVLVWMYRRHREHYGVARTALAISTAIGLVGYLFLPTAPPRLLPEGGLRDTLADTQNWGWWSDDGSVPRGLGGLTNQFAAMPSLHVGWAVWCGVLVARYAQRRWVRALGLAYPVITSLVVMATGNHYLLDAVAGLLTMSVGALLAMRLPARFTTVPLGPVPAGSAAAARPRSSGRSPHVTRRSGPPDVSVARIRALTQWDPPLPADHLAAKAAADTEAAVDRRYCRVRG